VASSYSAVLERIERVLARHRHDSEPPSPQEIDDLYTDACAMILTLEAERAELERRLAAMALDDSVEGKESIRRARALGGRRGEIDRELAALRPLAAHLSTASDWVRDPLAREAEHLKI
jgi:hypothetical protein